MCSGCTLCVQAATLCVQARLARTKTDAELSTNSRGKVREAASPRNQDCSPAQPRLHPRATKASTPRARTPAQERREQLVRGYEAEADALCTFHPRVDAHSESLAELSGARAPLRGELAHELTRRLEAPPPAAATPCTMGCDSMHDGLQPCAMGCSLVR